MDDLGLLGPDTTYIHCTDSTDEELDLIASTGGTASIAPYVEMLMGHGPPPTGRLLERGVRPVALSVDVVSSVPGEMFTQMRTALVHERIGASHRHAGRGVLADAVRIGTCSSSPRSKARARAGSRTKSVRSRRGSRPTSCSCNVNAINTAPMVDPIGTIVVFADTSNVDSVFVAGHAVKRNGQLVDADLDQIFSKLDESRNHILGEGELLPEWAAEPSAAV